MARTTVYNNNLTASWDEVSEDNQRLVKDFIKYCKANDKSPQTVKQYEEWLKVFFCWNLAENDDKFFVDLRKRDFVYYFGWCRDLGMSASRVASLKSVLSSLSSEIELLYEDVYPNFHSQLRGLEPIHISAVREKTVISDNKMKEILDGLVERKEYQAACYFALACASGARKAELLQMRPSFFDKSNEVFDGYMYCTPELRSKGRGKRGKIIRKYVIKELFRPYLDLWIEERGRLGIDSEFLFVTKDDGGAWRQATVSTANGFAEKVSKLFGIDYYSHASRHFFCTSLKKMELPDDVVVQIIGWSEKTGSSMINIYDDTDKNERMEKFFRSAGLGRRKDEEAKGE